MENTQNKQFGEDYEKKKKIFEKFVSTIENSNTEILENLPYISESLSSKKLRTYYYILGPNSDNNEISFGFIRDYKLPDEIETKLLHAFDKTFKNIKDF